MKVNSKEGLRKLFSAGVDNVALLKKLAAKIPPEKLDLEILLRAQVPKSRKGAATVAEVAISNIARDLMFKIPPENLDIKLLFGEYGPDRYDIEALAKKIPPENLDLITLLGNRLSKDTWMGNLIDKLAMKIPLGKLDLEILLKYRHTEWNSENMGIFYLTERLALKIPRENLNIETLLKLRESDNANERNLAQNLIRKNFPEHNATPLENIFKKYFC